MKTEIIGTVVIILICMATPVMAEPTPFVINGHVYDFCGNPCNDSWVRVTNLNTSEDWDVRNLSESNYYLLMLDSDDMIAGDVLRFDAQGCLQSKTVTHTVAADEITTGGFVVDNIMLEPAAGPDIAVTATNMPDHIYCGRATQIHTTVENIGTVDVGTFDLTFEVDGTVVDTVSTVLPLKICSRTDVAFTWMPASAGTYTLKVTADPGEKISESDGTNNDLTESVQIVSSTTIYVPANYSTIQDAINASSAGTTIVVSPKSDTDNVYYEHVNISSDGIRLIAEGDVVIRNDASGTAEIPYPADQITVWSEGCTVQGFDLRGGGTGPYPNYPGVGVRLCSDYNIVKDNHIYHTSGGIQIEDSSYNLIENNTIGPGILLVMGIWGDHNLIADNTFGSDNRNTWRLGGDMGSWDKPASYNIVRGNTFAGRLTRTILKGSDNLVYNNRFLGYEEMGSENTYNITKTPGTNIMGGPYLGGNYWSDYTGNDTDGDGIGETPYSYDQLPLVEYTPTYTTVDAVIALSIAVGSCEYNPEMDVNNDGKVTSLDALMILQAASGAIEIT